MVKFHIGYTILASIGLPLITLLVIFIIILIANSYVGIKKSNNIFKLFTSDGIKCLMAQNVQTKKINNTKVPDMDSIFDTPQDAMAHLHNCHEPKLFMMMGSRFYELDNEKKYKRISSQQIV